MRKDRRRITTTLLAIALVVLVLAGCGKYTSGEAFRGENAQDTPEGAVQKWLGSMEWKKNPDGVRDPEKGRDADAFIAVSDPALFQDPTSGMDATDADVQAFKDEWSAKDWEIEFLDLQFETVSNDGATAVVNIVGGQVRYIGKKMFGTTEYKVDDFRDKQGEITLKKFPDVNGNMTWRVIKGKVIKDDEYWES